MKVAFVVRDHGQTVHHGRSADQDVGVADRLASLLEIRVDAGREENDFVGEREDLARAAEAFERLKLSGRVLGLEPAEDLVARDDRER